MNSLDQVLAFLVVSLLVLAGVAVAGYIVLRKVFMRGADRMAHHINRVLTRVPLTQLALTHLGAYAAAQGLSEEDARAQFHRSIERTSKIMDSAVKLPIIGGVGLDSLLGLFPVAGDAVSAAVSVRLIAKSLRYGIPHEIITKMLANVLVDLLLGSIPIVGDLVDMWFKANERNVALLREYLGDEASNTIDAEVVSRT